MPPNPRPLLVRLAEWFSPEPTDFDKDADHVAQVSGLGYQKVLLTLHQKRAPRNYIEIGVHVGNTLKMATGPAIGIDPEFLCQDALTGHPERQFFEMTSDEFFALRDPGAIFGQPVDMAFLDGLHWFEFLLRDFINTERHCARDSLILLHDCLPPGFIMTARDSASKDDPRNILPRAWTGDVWKIVPTLQRYRPDLDIRLLDAAPTGLVLITNLNPASRVLKSKMNRITRTFREYSRREYERYWRDVEISSAAEVLNTLFPDSSSPAGPAPASPLSSP